MFQNLVSPNLGFFKPKLGQNHTRLTQRFNTWVSPSLGLRNMPFAGLIRFAAVLCIFPCASFAWLWNPESPLQNDMHAKHV